MWQVYILKVHFAAITVCKVRAYPLSNPPDRGPEAAEHQPVSSAVLPYELGVASVESLVATAWWALCLEEQLPFNRLRGGYS